MVNKTQEKTHDGGQTALTGFAAQTVAALLRGLRTHDWATVALEPSTAEEGVDVVDILWVLASGVKRREQVKATEGTFTPKQIEDWLKELADAAAAGTEVGLTLVGRPGSTVDVSQLPPSVEVRATSIASALRDASFEAMRLLEKLGTRLLTSDANVLVEKLVALMLLRSRDGYEWTRAELLNLLRTEASSVEALSRRGSVIDVVRGLTRTLVVGRAGAYDDYQTYLVRNDTASKLDFVLWFRLTDAGSVRTLQISDGIAAEVPDDNWDQGTSVEDSSSFCLGISPRGGLKPGESRLMTAVFSRADTFTPLGGSDLLFGDVLLPSRGSFVAETTVVLPEGCWEFNTDASDRTTSMVRWSRAIQAEPTRLTSSMRRLGNWDRSDADARRAVLARAAEVPKSLEAFERATREVDRLF